MSPADFDHLISGSWPVAVLAMGGAYVVSWVLRMLD